MSVESIYVSQNNRPNSSRDVTFLRITHTHNQRIIY